MDSRSGYSNDADPWEHIRWRGAVASALRGERGQALLREMLAAMLALPERKLIANDMERGGQVCSLGAVMRARGLDTNIKDCAIIAARLGIAEAMTREVMAVNDYKDGEAPEMRFERMLKWIEGKIRG